jgi:hypothetical protein
LNQIPKKSIAQIHTHFSLSAQNLFHPSSIHFCLQSCVLPAGLSHLASQSTHEPPSPSSTSSQAPPLPDSERTPPLRASPPARSHTTKLTAYNSTMARPSVSPPPGSPLASALVTEAFKLHSPADRLNTPAPPPLPPQPYKRNRCPYRLPYNSTSPLVSLPITQALTLTSSTSCRRFSLLPSELHHTACPELPSVSLPSTTSLS